MSRLTRVQQLRRRDGDGCCYCGQAMVFEKPRRMPGVQWDNHAWRETIEHVIDRQYGGTNDLSNLRLAHRRCNNGMNYTPPEEKVALMLAAACATDASQAVRDEPPSTHIKGRDGG